MRHLDIIKQLTRTQWEIISYGVVLLMSASLIFSIIDTKTSLKLDNDKLIYTGYVRNYRMNGQGVLTYSNGDRYEGQFQNGVFHGQGTFTSHAGWSYVGEFKKGQADGKGILTTEDKAVYDGVFKQGIYQK